MGKRARDTKATRHDDGRLVIVWNVLGAVDGTPVDLHFAEVDGRAVCARVEIGADFTDPQSPDPQPITSELVRGLGLSTLIAETTSRYADFLRKLAGWEWESSPRARDRLPAAEAAVEERRRPGRPRLHDLEHYQAVATFYNAERQANTRHPTKAVAERWSVSASTAAKWVSHARHELRLIPLAAR